MDRSMFACMSLLWRDSRVESMESMWLCRRRFRVGKGIWRIDWIGSRGRCQAISNETTAINQCNQNCSDLLEAKKHV
jgi:hypothetical protein